MIISMEGSEGTGKSTLFSLLKQDKEFIDLVKLNYGLDILFSKEPTNSIFGSFFKDTFLSGKEHNHSNMTQVLSLLLDRSCNLDSLSGQKSSLIILDRFIDSTLVYQVLMNKTLSENDVSDYLRLFEICYKHIIGKNLLPLKTLYFECPIETSMYRVSKRSSIHSDINDFKDVSFFQDIIDSYEKVINIEPNRFLRLNTDTTLSKSYNTLKDSIFSILKSN